MTTRLLSEMYRAGLKVGRARRLASVLAAALVVAAFWVGQSLPASAKSTPPPPQQTAPHPHASKSPALRNLQTASSIPWVWQDPRPDGNPFFAISCPTTTFCWAGGYSQLAQTVDGMTWTTQPAVETNAISCADTTHCVAVGDSGEVLTWNGTTWSAQVINSGNFLLGVSCPSAGTCYATGANGFIYKSTDGGATWPNPVNVTGSLGFPPFFAISCGTTMFCWAVGPTGLEAWTKDGVTWNLGTAGSNDLYGVGCSGTLGCVAVGLNGVVVTTTDPQLGFSVGFESSAATLVGVSCQSAPCFATGVDGSAYLMPNFATPRPNYFTHGSTGENGGLFAISCPAAATCFAAGDFGTISTTTDGGNAWNLTGLPASPTGISCPGATTCFAVGSGGSIQHTTDGSTWGAQASNTGSFLRSVSCSSTLHCVAVGDNGTIDVTVDGSTWTVKPSGTTNSIFSVSCASDLVCYAVDGVNDYKSTDGGLTWTSAAITGATSVSGISCPSITTCFASEATSPGIVLKTTDSGATWPVSFNVGSDPNAGSNAPLRAISCSSTSECYAVGDSGLIATTTDGATWRTDFANSTANLSSVNCPSAGTCYASANDETILHTADYGADWDIQMGSRNFSSVSCPSAAACFAAAASGVSKTTTSGAAWTVERPTGTTAPITALSCFGFSNCVAAAQHTVLVSHDGGNTWTQHVLGTTDQVDSVSCPSANTCYGVGWPGAIYKTIDGGSTWVLQTSGFYGSDNVLTSVSCPDTTDCVAVGIGGLAFSTSNGSAWVQESTNTPNSLFGVSCATTSACVATGSGGVVTVRSSGTWTVHSSGTLQNLDAVKCATLSICYAVGRSGTVLTSATGGATWTAKTSGTTNNLLGIDCSQPTRCIAGGVGGTAIITTDGSTWVPLNMPTPNAFIAIQFKDTVHVWMAGGGGMILAIASCASATVSSIETSPQPGGTTVHFTATSSGPFCTNPLYQWWVWSPATGYQLRQAYSTSPTFQLNTTGMAPGTYTIDVWVEQSGSILGTLGYETFALQSWVVGGCDSASVTPNPAPTTGIQTFTATAAGVGCTSPQFQYWFYSVAGGWQIMRPYSTVPTFSIDTSTLKSTTYSVDVWVKQSGSPLQYETWALGTIPKGACGTGATTTIGSVPASPQAEGTPVTFTTASTCGATPYYKYWAYPGNGTQPAYQTLQGYSTNAVYSWNTTAGWKPGTQSIIVHVTKQAPTSPTQAPDTWGLVSYTLLGCSSATIAASPPSPQELGTSNVTFTATAGGCSNAQYQFYYYPPGGPWVKAQDWSSANTYNWNEAGLPPGTYAFVVYVRKQGTGNQFDSFALISYTTS